MSIISTIEPLAFSRIPLTCKPRAAIMAFGIHGPAESESYKTEDHWSVHLYTYSAKVVIDGRKYPIQPGYVSVVPPGAEAVYSFPHRSIHLCAHFTFPKLPDDDLVEISVMQDAGPRFAQLCQQFEEAIGGFRGLPDPFGGAVMGRFVAVGGSARQDHLPHHAHHPALVKAQELIELRLAEHISVPEIARAVSISHNQLIRLFRASVDNTVIGYIHERRAIRAEHLLRNTHLPISTIARQVGVDDPRLFNKLIHQFFGSSPTALRERRNTVPDQV